MHLSKIKNMADDKRQLTLTIQGVIGQSWYDAEDKSVNELLAMIDSFEPTEKDEIHVIINSQGGNYFAGVQLHNKLKECQAKVITKNVGLAASAASVIFCAGDERVAYKGSITMAHLPLVNVGYANADDLKRLAEELEPVGESMKALYMDSTGIDESLLDSLVKAEKNMSPDEAVSNGFATKVSDSSDYKACSINADVKGAQKREIMARLDPVFEQGKASADSVIKACAESGLNEMIARINEKGFTEKELKATVSNIKDIKNVCAATGVNFDDINKSVFNNGDLLRAFAAAISQDNETIESGKSQTQETFNITPITGA